MIKPRTSFKNFGRPKRLTDDPVKISTTYDIVGHSEKPFQQRKTFYPQQNYTDIIVEAHNVSSVLLQFFSLSVVIFSIQEYGENRFIIDHESGLRIGVIDDTCVISPESG